MRQAIAPYHTMKAKYTPRRATKRWRIDAPDYILDCFDNKGKTADRYTVLFTGKLLLRRNGSTSFADTFVQYLGMSDAPTHPQGFSQWGELSAFQAANYRTSTAYQRVAWNDLPEHIRRHVVSRASE